jgi:hypothetical protein
MAAHRIGVFHRSCIGPGDAQLFVLGGYVLPDARLVAAMACSGSNVRTNGLHVGAAKPRIAEVCRRSEVVAFLVVPAAVLDTRDRQYRLVPRGNQNAGAQHPVLHRPLEVLAVEDENR